MSCLVDGVRLGRSVFFPTPPLLGMALPLSVILLLSFDQSRAWHSSAKSMKPEVLGQAQAFVFVTGPSRLHASELPVLPFSYLRGAMPDSTAIVIAKIARSALKFSPLRAEFPRFLFLQFGLCCSFFACSSATIRNFTSTLAVRSRLRA